jgi:hypothetical protein
MFRQHAITILPDAVCAEIRLLCLRYYAVPSVGWSHGSGCAICRDTTRQQIRHLTGCLAPAESCRCNICVRQPPSLKALAFHAHFTLVLNIEWFKLTRHVTYSVSWRLRRQLGHYWACATPEFPSITIMHTFTYCLSRPSHATCSPGQSWIVAATRTFDSRD